MIVVTLANAKGREIMARSSNRGPCRTGPYGFPVSGGDDSYLALRSRASALYGRAADLNGMYASEPCLSTSVDFSLQLGQGYARMPPRLKNP